MATQHVQVGIIGAGPAGLMLANLLRLAGIESVILEARTRTYCETRIRAGLLEQGSVDLMDEIGAAERLHREALVHDGIFLRYNGRNHHVSIKELTGRSMYIYGQQESVKDLIALQLAAGGDIRFECSDVAIEELDSDKPALRYVDAAGNDVRVSCDFIAGCDGFHGVSRASIPAGEIETYDLGVSVRVVRHSQ